MTTERLIALLGAAIDEFYLRDRYLVDLDVNERTCVARIAHYLQNLLDKDPIWHDISVDCEYNRQTEEIPPENKSTKRCKRTPQASRGIFPDLIVHCRGKNDRNLLVAEFKKGGTQYEKDGREKDKKIIHELMDAPDKHYWCGVYIVLGNQGATFEKITSRTRSTK